MPPPPSFCYVARQESDKREFLRFNSDLPAVSFVVDAFVDCSGRRCGKPPRRYLLRNASMVREASGAVTVPRSTFIDDLGRLAGKAHRSDMLLVRLLRSVRESKGKSCETSCRKQDREWGGRRGEGSARLRASVKTVTPSKSNERRSKASNCCRFSFLSSSSCGCTREPHLRGVVPGVSLRASGLSASL